MNQDEQSNIRPPTVILYIPTLFEWTSHNCDGYIMPISIFTVKSLNGNLHACISI